MSRRVRTLEKRAGVGKEVGPCPECKGRIISEERRGDGTQ
jgi:hypothetical protein